ncbi:helix-turn-helix domain-containing protein [Halalkalirubrum salinum]|uniref:helix-turn-helix domain-containing protein n=1 Tax=Halalkalirubrum salinum TaxID=2563889 RepID=UPI0010FBACC6|nr:helix-turn-helix domain-containing protein [Halalkalirubrum salinum]
MSVVAEFTIDADEFLLGQIFSQDSVAHLELECVVPASRQIMPYVWIYGNGLDQTESSIRDSEQVETLTKLDQTDDSALYRIEWGDEQEGLIDGIIETNATILEARRKEKWFFRIRFDSHRQLTAFNTFCRRHSISVKLHNLYSLTDSGTPPKFELTDSQRETLFQAVRDGYFEVPRRTTLGEVGDKIGITEQTASENLRRGANKVLKNVLLGQR